MELLLIPFFFLWELCSHKCMWRDVCVLRHSSSWKHAFLVVPRETQAFKSYHGFILSSCELYAYTEIKKKLKKRY